MRFNYKNKEYEVMELVDIGGTCFFGMVVLFEIQYVSYEGNKRVLHSEEEFLDQKDDIWEEKVYINHFPIDNKEQSNIINSCEYFIDHQWDKNFSELKFYMMELRKVQEKFDKDNETYIEKLEFAKYDLYDWVKDNIQLEGEDD